MRKFAVLAAPAPSPHVSILSFRLSALAAMFLDHIQGSNSHTPAIRRGIALERILVTTSSFQDTPGFHHELLARTAAEIVSIRGPLNEEQILDVAGDFDAFLCGNDAITRRVLARSAPRLKVISQYGNGLDKIDLDAAEEHGIAVLYTPGVNHRTVAEHVFGLMLAVARDLISHSTETSRGEWRRGIGVELDGKTLGIIGLGNIGREVARRARGFGMHLIGYDPVWTGDLVESHCIGRMNTIEDLLGHSDFLALCCDLNPQTHHLLNQDSLTFCKPSAIIVNCSRGEVVDSAALSAALSSGKVAGYGTDVLDVEPPPADHPLLNSPNTIVTPHVASRTHENVARQALMSVENLLHFVSGKGDFHRYV